MWGASRIVSGFRSLFRKRELDQDLDDELRAYLDLLVQERTAKGVSPERALREARLELGGLEQVKERVREDRVGAVIDVLLQDVRYTGRALRRDLGFAVVAVLTLAIGIGATTALFSTVNAALLRRIPFAEPHQLVAGQTTWEGSLAGAVSRVDYFDYRELGRSFQDLAALADIPMPYTIMGRDGPELASAAFVTWNLFRTLGVSPVVGRPFIREEEARGAAPVVLVSHGFWQSRFGGSLDALGSTLEMDGTQYTVVGVMPRGFRFLFDADLWRLVDQEGPFDATRDSHSHILVGRLKPGVSIGQAQSEVDAISRGLGRQYPDTNEGKGLRLTQLHGFMVAQVRPALLLLMATTTLVLLIACGNVAGLLLARGQRRLSEMAMRSALGASRRRLVRQLLTESLFLTLLAGLAGVGLAFLLQQLVQRLLPMEALGIDGLTVDGAALLFAFAVSIATGLAIGVAPALRGTAVNLSEQLGTGTRVSEGARSTRIRSGFVVLQVAVSIVLLVGSGLLIRSLARLTTVELGFDPQNLLTAQLQIQKEDYPAPEQRAAFFGSLLEEFGALPGVTSAAAINMLPILDPYQNWGIWPADQPAPPVKDGRTALARWVSPGYFDTMRIPVLKGRDIAETDVTGAPLVLVVNETAARGLFPGLDPLGREVNVAGWRVLQVVGVVGDARLNGLRDTPEPAIYMSAAQMKARRLSIVVRGSGDPTLLVAPIRRILQRKDPGVVLGQPATMVSIIDDVLADFRVVILSLGLFSGVALFLTAIGLYGVLAYHVSQRSNEIGIRLALGASKVSLLGLVARRGLGLVVAGLCLGMASAFPGSLLLRQLLFETQPLDAATYVRAAAFLGLVAMLACVTPAWRAAQVDPVEVLRRE
jgi:putative ABC transport system permease protein